MNDETQWDLFSRFFVNFAEPKFLPTAQILFDSLNIEKAQNVLEVGAASGYNIRHFISQKPKSCHWVVTDICELMLQMCDQRIQEFLKNPFEKIEHNYMTEEFPKFEEKKIEVLNLSIQKADAQNLKQFEQNSFDRYYANQVLGNRPERVKILKEAWRVLMPDGLLGFTVFGRKENCQWLTLVKDTAFEQGAYSGKLPQKDEFQNLSKSIIEFELEQTGFKITNHFYVTFPIFNSDQAFTKQGIQSQLAEDELDIDEAMLEKIFIAIQEKLKANREKKMPLTMEAQYFIAVKEAK